jgi:serine/threonine-protein kinase
MIETDERIGRAIAGKYRVDELIGEGGLGRVYRAAHLELGSDVAIKFLAATPGRDNRERFRREERALAVLRHPGIVSVLDFGEQDGELYLVMELITGPRLAECILMDGAPMAFPRIVGIARQILGVLEATHGAGVVHRDLKPDNVMLAAAGDRADHVKVLDFGIALFVEEPGAPRLTATQGVQGTPLYMSPEQCRGRDVGPAADIYAMGAVLYEMLCGEPPFDAPSAVELMARHLYVAPSPVEERGVGRPVPADLEQLALRALSKQPAERPTAAQMLDELGQFSRGSAAAEVAQRAVDERIRAVALSRSQRGLPAPDTLDPISVADTISADAAPGDRPAIASVDAWGLSDERAGDLQAALSLHGVQLRCWRGDGPPPAQAPGGEPVKAVVVPGDASAAERIRLLKARPEGASVPVLAADARPEATAVLVRAGASDVALSIVGDEVLCGKLLRLIRRGR